MIKSLLGHVIGLVLVYAIYTVLWGCFALVTCIEGWLGIADRELP